jgi:hypothetical protein
METIWTDTFDKEEYFAFYIFVFYRESKKLVIEKRYVKNKKGKSYSEMNVWNILPSYLSHIHQATRDALDNSISGLEAENVRLKERIKELEGALMPLPRFATPLEMIEPTAPTEKLKG